MPATVSPRSAEEALARVLRESLHGDARWHGLCLKAVRTMLRVPAAAPTARAAWEALPPLARRAGPPPPGSPGWFDVGRSWHVVLGAGYGLCWSTDIVRIGRFDVLAISEVERIWGAKYLGWATVLNGVRVPRSE